MQEYKTSKTSNKTITVTKYLLQKLQIRGEDAQPYQQTTRDMEGGYIRDQKNIQKPKNKLP